PKKITANVIETNEIPLASQLASEKYPVTLFTYDCGEICQNAEALLNRRGVHRLRAPTNPRPVRKPRRRQAPRLPLLRQRRLRAADTRSSSRSARFATRVPQQP